MLQNHRFINFLKQNFMKTLILAANYLLIALIFTNLQTKTVMAQFYDPTTADVSATQTTTNVAARNTGNDIMEFEFNTGDEMRVSVWDDDISNAAGFSWEETATNSIGHQILDGTNYGTVNDPDIIISREGYLVYIVYQLDFSDIYYEAWEYNVGSWSLFIGATQLNTATPASNPNIDGVGVYDFEMVAVWEQDGGEIWAVAGDYNTGFSSYAPMHIQNPGVGMWPDVSIYHNTVTGNRMVNFTYIRDGGTAWRLYQQREPLANIQAGTPAATPTFLLTVNSGEFSRPRIASAVSIVNDDSNFAIAVRYWDSSNDRYYIYTWARCTSSLSGPNIINASTPDLTTASSVCFVNDEPAIAYAYDHIMVVWTYDDACFLNQSLDIDVIQKRCHPCTGASSTSEYLIVNDFPGSFGGYNQMAGSVASRHSPHYNTIYTFWDEDKVDVIYKTSFFGNSPIRISGTQKHSNKVNFYPNPAEYIVKVKSSDNISSIKVLNLQGQVVKLIEGYFDEINLSLLNNGMYLMNIIFENNQIESFKLQIAK